MCAYEPLSDELVRAKAKQLTGVDFLFNKASDKAMPSVLASIFKAISTAVDVWTEREKIAEVNSVDAFFVTLMERLGIDELDPKGPPEPSGHYAKFYAELSFSPWRPSVWKFLCSISPDDEYLNEVDKYMRIK